eukprot:TRINITY_DN4566_c0_g2_i1.p1 TRINITY_DN4566_c0_g2~~TRINITY_DN4566_c0_g2_i1.p1  ORF type:complete len:824 (-),score=166.55 TRINITY_DN4566_c0_g2_i1:752-2959(-)
MEGADEEVVLSQLGGQASHLLSIREVSQEGRATEEDFMEVQPAKGEAMEGLLLLGPPEGGMEQPPDTLGTIDNKRELDGMHLHLPSKKQKQTSGESKGAVVGHDMLQTEEGKKVPFEKSEAGGFVVKNDESAGAVLPVKRRNRGARKADIPVGPRVHKCGHCGKVFSSHQALGGHTASHNQGRANRAAAGLELQGVRRDKPGRKSVKGGNISRASAEGGEQLALVPASGEGGSGRKQHLSEGTVTVRQHFVGPMPTYRQSDVEAGGRAREQVAQRSSGPLSLSHRADSERDARGPPYYPTAQVVKALKELCNDPHLKALLAFRSSSQQHSSAGDPPVASRPALSPPRHDSAARPPSHSPEPTVASPYRASSLLYCPESLRMEEDFAASGTSGGRRDGDTGRVPPLSLAVGTAQSDESATATWLQVQDQLAGGLDLNSPPPQDGPMFSPPQPAPLSGPSVKEGQMSRQGGASLPGAASLNDPEEEEEDGTITSMETNSPSKQTKREWTKQDSFVGEAFGEVSVELIPQLRLLVDPSTSAEPIRSFAMPSPDRPSLAAINLSELVVNHLRSESDTPPPVGTPSHNWTTATFNENSTLPLPSLCALGSSLPAALFESQQSALTSLMSSNGLTLRGGISEMDSSGKFLSRNSPPQRLPSDESVSNSWPLVPLAPRSSTCKHGAPQLEAMGDELVPGVNSQRASSPPLPLTAISATVAAICADPALFQLVTALMGRTNTC